MAVGKRPWLACYRQGGIVTELHKLQARIDRLREQGMSDIKFSGPLFYATLVPAPNELTVEQARDITMDRYRPAFEKLAKL